jgi:DNA invertase Pin-like site-specific DNA recombinase
VKTARIYIRASVDEEDLPRQAALKDAVERACFTLGGVYAEKAGGARADRPALRRLMADLGAGDVVIAEQLELMARLPLDEAASLVDRIRAAGARLSVPGLVDLADVVTTSHGVTRVVLEAEQDLLLKIVLQLARENHETMRRRRLVGVERARGQGKYRGGRKPDIALHARIVALRTSAHSIADTARLAGCSEGLVKLVWREHQAQQLAAVAATRPTPNP